MRDILLNNDMFDTGDNQNYYGPIDVKYFSHDYLEKNQEWASDMPSLKQYLWFGTSMEINVKHKQKHNFRII